MHKGKQHTIPNCYLRAWCDPQSLHERNPYIWRIKRDGSEKKRKSPGKSFTARDRYTIRLADGQRNLIVEEKLAAVEDSFVRVLRLIERRTNLGAADRARLCFFAAAMVSRTIVMGDRITSFWTDLQRLTVALENKRDSRANNSFASLKPADNVHPAFVSASLKFGTPLLFRMAMTIFVSDDDLGFITSDNPCVWLNPNMHRLPPAMRSLGLNHRSIEVSLPLSPRHLMLLTHRTGPFQYVDINRSATDELNRRTRFHCTEEFVSWKGETRPIWFDLGKEPEGSWEKTEEGKRALTERDRMANAKEKHEQWLKRRNAVFEKNDREEAT